MPVSEPSGPLWSAVKAIYDPWPLDQEAAATALADAWRQGGAAMVMGASRSISAGNAAHAAWQDPAGGGFDTTVADRSRPMADLQPQMELAASRGDGYAAELVAVKNDIVSTIAANNGLYTLLGNPLFGALGAALQQRLATSIAGSLRSMVEARAAALSTGAAGAVPQPPPPPPAPPPPAPRKDDGNFWSDLGHTALDVIGLVPVVGEAADAINAGWYAAEGDWVNAGLSLAAMVPIAGWAATGGKLGYKAINEAVRLQPVTSPTAALAFVKNRPPGVPLRAETLPFTPTKRFPVGTKHTWTDPKLGQVTRHAHGLDTKRFEKAAQKGEDVGNAARGPVYRMRVEDGYFKGYADEAGNSHHISTVRKDDDIANATHIPASRHYPAPDETHTRVAVPNVAALGPNDSDGERN
ncbi:WXG100-like domain-containing protein [Actinophytocola gossypii]|uniref:Outer membrane channel protein CpnT-like N-terminal domain-containing protein n=1 Tax=Actinophytocola gossypii TaxID=2812003 RepID=A0ABT2J321_9PSEU|nr:hypothetical protein [Actinophytocola gossypii]MCT2582004.1 hypothetical protein [Actinophytocola gossypii]